jgi:hypothetical protein
MSSSQNRMLVFNGSFYEPLTVDTNGRLDANIHTTTPLDVDIVSSTGTLNTSDATAQASLASVDGKITACDTSALATEATLASVDGKITACDTSALATEATLASVDGKITACNTSAVVVSSAPVIQGSNGGTPTAVQVDSHGCVSVKVKENENAGSYGNAWNNASIIASDTSTVIDVSALSHCNLFILDSDHTSTDTYSIWVSADATNYHQLYVLYPYDKRATGSVREDNVLLELHGLTHLYIQNEGGAKTGVYGSVYGSP